MHHTLVLVLCLFLCFATAAVGGVFTRMGLGPWYDGLQKPSWQPPAWVFGPVWTTLYTLMAVAAWLVVRQRNEAPGWKTALALFVVNLLLNVLWSALFFGARQPGWAFAEILVLWGTIVALVVLFHRIRPLAGWLLTPYLAWVSFAAVLNGVVWWLNCHL